jgi:hypothetical protein
MKVKELDFITSSEMSKLRDVANLEINVFIDRIKEMSSKGARIPALYDRIYHSLQRLHIEDLSIETVAEEPQVDELKILYDGIPIKELYYHFPEKERLISQLKSLGEKTIGELYTLDQKSINGLPGIGPKTALEIKELQQSLKDDSSKIIECWHESTKIYELPSNYDSGLGLIPNLQNAITELVSIMESRLHNLRYIDTSKRKETQELRINILKLFYQEGKNDIQIAKILGKTQTHISNNRRDVVTPFYWGRSIESNFYKNIILRSGLVELVKSLEKECVFKEKTKFTNYTGSSDESFLADFGLDLTKVLDIDFIIPKDTKGIYSQVGKDVVSVLRDKVVPCSPDEIARIVEDSPKSAELDYDSIFVYNILSCTDIVEIHEGGNIQIQYKYLSSVSQKYARIIYESGRHLTKEEIFKEFEKRDGYIPTSNPSSSKEFGISFEGNMWYYGEPRIPLQRKVMAFSEEKKIFYYEEILQFLRDEGYSIPQTIRNNITNVCVVDNKDKNHFCHKEFVDDYPKFSWRNPTRYGQTNWILNEIKIILEEGKELSEKELLVELERRSLSTEYNAVVVKRSKYIFEDYCGDDKPFMIENGLVVKNNLVFENTEFAYIGLREGMYVYYPQIRSIAANEVKKTEQGSIPFEAFRVIVNEIIGEEIGRNVIKRALEDKNKRFSPIDVELVSDENGNLFLHWTKQETIPEPVYEIKASDDEQEIEEVKEVAVVEHRPDIKFRQVINWNDLSAQLKQELSFYNLWMLREEYDLDSSIDQFLAFLKHAENSNLSRKLPQNLYEYWFASTDSYDRSTYLSNLALFFEAFLAEINYQTTGVKRSKKGLSDWAEEFPGLPQKLLFSKDNKGFARIASDLHYRRNKIAHGEDIRLNSLETAKTIVDYVALYVYVLARYYKKILTVKR